MLKFEITKTISESVNSESLNTCVVLSIFLHDPDFPFNDAAFPVQCQPVATSLLTIPEGSVKLLMRMDEGPGILGGQLFKYFPNFVRFFRYFLTRV